RIDEIKLKDNNALISTLPFYDYGETEQTNLLGSGRLWLGELIKSSFLFSTNTEDFESDYQLQFEVFPMGKATQFLKVSSGSEALGNYDLKGTLYTSNNSVDRYRRISNSYPIRVSSQKALKDITLNLSSESVGNVGVYFNYWAVNYNRTLK